MYHLDQYTTLHPDDTTTIIGGTAVWLQLSKRGKDIQATGIDVFIDTTHELQVIIQRWVDILPESYDLHIDDDRPNDVFKLVDTASGLPFNIFIDSDYVTIGDVDVIDNRRVVSILELTEQYGWLTKQLYIQLVKKGQMDMDDDQHILLTTEYNTITVMYFMLMACCVE